MVFNSAEMAIGQLWRSLTHVRTFNEACRHPRQTQLAKLLKIVAANRETAYGRKHGFAKIKSVEEFRSAVPVNTYEDLSPYIEALMNGAKNQLTTEEPFMFATTSGTTAKPKYIPINETHLKDYTHAFQIHNYSMINDYRPHPDGRFLIITSNDEEGRVPSGLPYGAVSGVLNRRQPPIIRKHFAVPYELCKVSNVDMKYYLMLRCALAQEIVAIFACNPSSMLLLADQLREHAEDLVADIFDGTLKSVYAPEAGLRDAFAPFLKADRQRARQLEAILNRDGVLKPKDIWSRLILLSTWKGGAMSFYLDRLPEAYGNVPVRDFGYMASEGRGSIPLSDNGAGGVTAITSHFFEFVEESDSESATPDFLTAEELSLGKRYYIFLTTSAGLYRYNINDLIHVSGFHGNTPIIEFVRKGMGISSITGEKITETQVLTALTHAVNHLKLNSICHFTTEVELGLPPHYVCYVEANTSLPQSVQDEFIRLFDQSLSLQNSEYKDKRLTKRLGVPSVRLLPAGTYTRLRQQRVLEGAPEAQIKIPLLSTPTAFSGRLAMLGVKA